MQRHAIKKVHVDTLLIHSSPTRMNLPFESQMGTALFFCTVYPSLLQAQDARRVLTNRPAPYRPLPPENNPHVPYQVRTFEPPSKQGPWRPVCGTRRGGELRPGRTYSKHRPVIAFQGFVHRHLNVEFGRVTHSLDPLSCICGGLSAWYT